MTLPALAALLSLLLAGCCSPVTCPSVGVPAFFVEKHVCPADRVVGRERPDLPYHRFVCTGPGAATCDLPALPDEVAGDPARLALWREAAREKLSVIDAQATSAFEVEGCGKRELYACRRTRNRRGEGVDCSARGLVFLGTAEPPPGP